MEIIGGIVGGIVVVIILGSALGLDDFILEIYKTKIEIAKEHRLEAEARLEEARLRSNPHHEC